MSLGAALAAMVLAYTALWCAVSFMIGLLRRAGNDY